MFIRPVTEGFQYRCHYICDTCPNEFAQDMAQPDVGYCPCCEGLVSPYDIESLFDPEEDSYDL